MKLDDLSRFIERLPFASIDHLRPVTQGHQEVILCQGKTVPQVVAIAEQLAAASGGFLATRSETEHRAALAAPFPRAEANELGRTVYLPPDPEPAATGRGTVLIVTAGTSDLPVAEEAAVTARALGNRVERLTDVGVAGIHRLLTQTDALRHAAVIIVVAGMEGALPSVVGGLVKVPVIAVPTSVGYGASFGGLAAPPADLSHTLDLLRRANGAVCGWAVGLEDGELEVSGDAHVHKDHLRRGAALVQLASADGRSHVAREPEGTYVAAGDFPYGAGLLLLQPNASTDLAEAVVDDLRRFVAALRLAELRTADAQHQNIARRLAVITGGAQTLEA